MRSSRPSPSTGGTVRVLDRAEAWGGKCVSYWEEPGVAVTVEFEVEQAGEYCLTLEYACNWEDTRRRIALDGDVPPGLEDVLLHGTGSWADFDPMTVAAADGGRVRLQLTAGKHTLTLTNVDSRGLAWDCALLHDPEFMPADMPLAEDELLELAAKLGPTAERLILNDASEADLSLGHVTVGFGEQGLPRGVRLDDIVLLMPTLRGRGVTGPPMSLGPLQLRSASFRSIHIVTITEGRCVYLIVASTDDMKQFVLPAPAVTWREGRSFWIAPPGLEDLPKETATTRSYSVNGITVSATGQLRSLEDPHLPAGTFAFFDTLWTGEVSAGAVKIGPSISTGDSSIAAEVQGDEVIIRSSGKMYPALAAFYEMPQFECGVAPDGSMTLRAAGEELKLPPP